MSDLTLTIDREAILPVLDEAAAVAKSGQAKPHLSAIWIDAKIQTRVMAWNGEAEYVAEFGASCPHVVPQGQGVLGVDAGKLRSLVRALSDVREFILSGPGAAGEMGPAVLAAGRRRYKLPKVDASWMPQVSDAPQEVSVVDARALRAVLERVLHCVSSNPDMEGIACVRLAACDGDLLAMGMDGHQYARIRTGDLLPDASVLTDETGLLLGLKHAKALVKILSARGNEVGLAVYGGRLLARFGHEDAWCEELSLPLSQFSYPDTQNVEAATRERGEPLTDIYVDRAALLASLQRLSVFGDEARRDVKFQVDKNGLILLSGYGEDQGLGREELDAEIEGDALPQLSLDMTGVAGLLARFTSENVNLQIRGSLKPVAIVGVDETEEGYLAITMPMRDENTFYST